MRRRPSQLENADGTSSLSPVSDRGCNEGSAPKLNLRKARTLIELSKQEMVEEASGGVARFQKSSSDTIGGGISSFRSAVTVAQATKRLSASLGFSWSVFGSVSPRGNKRQESVTRENSLAPPSRETPTIAEIAFDSGTSSCCVISHIAKPSDFYDQVIVPEWKLYAPKVLLSIMGGAGNMKLREGEFDMESFSKGLVEAAIRTKAWVLTGGTRSGVMDVVGKAMKDHDRQRQVPCIGIIALGGLTSNWRSVFEDSFSREKIDAADARRVEPEFDPETKFPLAEIQENHSHFIICDNGLVGSKQFGTELPFRAEFEEYVTLDVKSDSESGSRAHVPRVTLLFNGGKVSLQGLVEAVSHGQPIVVCQGTGRIADVICSLMAAISAAETPDQEVEDTGDQEPRVPLSLEELAELFQDAVQEHMKNERLEHVDMEMTIRIVRSGLVEVYSINERLEDVILRAVLGTGATTGKQHGVSARHQLALAVQWGCTNYYECLGKRLVHECGGEKDGPRKAISIIFKDLVGYQNHRGGREHLNSQYALQVREHVSPVITWLLKDYHKQMDQFVISEETLGKVEWNRLSVSEWSSLEGLLLWSIEREAPASVLEAIWVYMEDPVHAALVTASACRELAGTKCLNASYVAAQKSLQATAARFERLAILVLEDFAQYGKAVEFLFQESNRWGAQGITCFRLAHQLGCKSFCSSEFFRLAVELYWMTPVPFSIKKKRLNDEFLSWWNLLSLLWDYEKCEFSTSELLSVPYIKAWTHGCSRVCFLAIYSYCVFKERLTSPGLSFFQVVLFMHGIGLAAVELQQLRQVNSFQEYIRDLWNFLDSLHITVLLVTLTLAVILTNLSSPWKEAEQVLVVLHSMNLLPCWIRVLQLLLLSEYFGTLIITTGAMCQDAMRFFMILAIICCGFSCAITPIIFSEGKEREQMGLTWAFWTVVGQIDQKATDKLQELWADNSVVARFTCIVASTMLYALSLVCNLLLVNLLIAVMNSTYEEHQEMSQTEWAFYRVNAVLEYDEFAMLPPPFNLLENFLHDYLSSTDSADESSRPDLRRNRSDLAITRRDLKDSQQKAARAVGFDENELGEMAVLRAEMTELRRRNSELELRNTKLEGLAANYMLENLGAFQGIESMSCDQVLTPSAFRKGRMRERLLAPPLPYPS